MSREITFQKTENYPRFIDNAPRGEDLFEGKSQEKIANIISDMLQRKENSSIIGIDGGWGSGKSNLVNLIIKNLLGKNFHFFIYDAWGHQEDLQRRSILEELTDELCSEKFKILEPIKWRKKLKNLLAKTREIEKRSIPSLSFGIILAGLAIVLTPLFKAIAENIHNPYLKAGFISVPLLSILGLYAFYFCKEIRIEKTSGKKRKKGQNALTNLFYIYQKAQTEDTTYETISEDEPSVRKFRDWMRAISEDINEYKLVLVFDNMDRLPKEKVQELWSSIHTFFAEQTYDNIHVIVPFDREHIKNAFKTEDGVNSENVKATNPDANPVTPIKGNNALEKSNCFGDDFINKTFSVVYRVSPPILSDWKNYFRLKWIDAFGENHIVEDSYSEVVQIYDLLRKYDTPRSIIAFINEFVAIKQLVENTVPDNYIALFILGKNKITSSPIDEIIKPSFMHSLWFMYKDDENLPKYLASLFYQIAPEQAIQVAFTEKLKNALNDNDQELVQKIGTIPEFSHILETAIAEIYNEANAILALYTIPDEKIGTKIKCQHIWDCLYHKVVTRKDQKLAEFQKILLLKTKFQSEYLQKILKDFVTASSFMAKDYYKSVLELETLFKDEKIDVFQMLIEKETSVEDFIQFVELAKGDYGKFNLNCDNDKLEDYLINLTEEGLKTIKIIPHIKEDYILDKYKKHLEAFINSENKDRDFVATIFTRYKEIEKPLAVKLSDLDIYSVVQDFTEGEDFYYDLLAMRISKLTSFNPSYSSYFDAALSNTDESIVIKIAERIEFYMDYDDLLIGLESFKQYPLFVKVANKLTDTSYGDSNAIVETIISHFEAICENGEINPGALIRRINDLDYDDINSLNIKKIASVPFFDCALAEECALTIHCIKCAKDYLNSLSPEQWKTALKDTNSYEFELSLLFHDYKYQQNAVDAIKALLKDIASGTIPIPDKKIWNDLIFRLESQGRMQTGTFNTIRDSFCRLENITPELFSFFGDWLFKYAELDKRQESLRTIFKSEILNNTISLDIILKNRDLIPSIMFASGNSEAHDFKEIIMSILNQTNDEKFIDFARSLGVVLPKDENKRDD